MSALQGVIVSVRTNVNYGGITETATELLSQPAQSPFHSWILERDWSESGTAKWRWTNTLPILAKLRCWRSLGGNIQSQPSPQGTWGVSGGVLVSVTSSHTSPVPLQGCCDSLSGWHPLKPAAHQDMSMPWKSTGCSRWAALGVEYWQ